MDADQPVTAPDLPASRGRSEWAYGRLHEAIGDGTIEPGQRLMEAEVAGWLQMSRTPVREALRRLQAEGLLEHAPGGGMAVVLYDLRAISEFYEMRENLEGAAAAMAARNADDTDMRILSATCEAIAALPKDSRRHARENQVFHEQLQAASHNRFLRKSLQALLNFVPLMGRTTYSVPGRIEDALNEHVAIVEAIKARDTVRADAAARFHIRQSHRARVLVVSDDVRQAASQRSLRDPKPGIGKLVRS